MLRISLGLLLLLCAYSAPATEAANILGLFSSHSPSHLIVHMSVAKALAEIGHNVTVVSMIKPPITHKNIHHILVPMTEEQERVLDRQVSVLASQKNNVFHMIKMILSGMSTMIESQYELMSDERFKRIYETKFDLMLLGYFLNDFQLGVAAKLGCPVIVSWMQAPMSIINDFVGNPTEMSYVPNLSTVVAAGESMGFAKRAENLAKELLFYGVKTILSLRSQRLYNTYFAGEPNFPTIDQMKRNISLVFTNSHSISEGPIRPLVPASVEIGGIQVKDVADPLPEDIANFLNEAQQGAILFSLGSNIKSTAVKPELLQVIFKVLSSLKQSVIWKWEDTENRPGTAPNILYKKWLPQDDILAHPRLKLFITHAGKGGLSEATYHGVPMVALPIFGDQHANSETVQKSGFGLRLELLQLTEETFKAALLEVLENDKYALTIKKFSDLYRDRPLTAKQTVVYWTDFVLRHRGALHLQSPAVRLSWLAYYNLDVYALLISLLVAILLLVGLVVRFIWHKLFKKQLKRKQQ